MTTPGDRLRRENRDLLAAEGTRRLVRRGTVLFRQDEESDSVLLVEHGLLRVCADTVDGQRLVLALRGDGALVGEFGVIGARRRSATVDAAVDSVVVAVPAERFRVLLGQRPALAHDVLCLLVARIDESDRRRVEAGTCLVSRRLARLLVDLVRSRGRPAPGGGYEVTVLSQEELGGAIGATRETVSRSLAELRAAGVLSTSRRRITVLRPGELARLARAPD
ncbi:cAMP-binding domain of CRP or a regulatory subunit of cAMP-dependent protein kinases [Streptoalloteichus tenebrarius]|uniref:cAMP-binding domain of CRP or a regulatory subunit of cAMP-dependent protein kinases n=1 Tax=Streptoalloteichus tenebrarius (strain ATCC 17920 / DSM 40477 / JCM 4838 / CBS 697.72 / NBRC 16177 / NCIMB 11028 / NRRL B-12390 / A12253. 1 / ISP 5477) TaxID=1933 RepID=A0ABT1HZF2_STRSD|nr:Crp/Fnr family transcriptional regulator [Streptoalloteichus tenebrarius]MCP2260899.1 cAMP-binding domain of CRP or a regulatory subunit of cAMP-dependent protein kinases [Streptoalloteichus tenebrarius]BFF03340.1 Crp/Fnr family transcriptional regulator [Streptoalloteichus tenebrarius]